jgi:hypothetical protein
LESQFFGSNKVHRLRDAFLDRSFEYTSTDTGRSRSEGRRAACSLLRTGTYGDPIEDRFDYAFISDEIGVTECRTIIRERG